MLRQPIVCVLGHVDHGKTTLLDSIRKTAVAARESGGITQHVSASEVPLSAIREVCGNLLEKMNVKLTLPGLLFIDTPGHEAFVNLRKRGGSIADIAILVIDINQGVQNQTREAIEILREYKTPFVVAATKIDALSGWRPIAKNACFSDAFMGQRKDVQEQLDAKLYELVGQLAEMNFSSERFDKISDFTKQVAIVPVSAKTSEGLGELLLFVGGLAQKFLESQLESRESELGKGSILEVREERGLGKTLNVILYEGRLRRADGIMFLSPEGKVVRSRIKALLEPSGKAAEGGEYREAEEATAAAGVKISCDEAESAVAGSSVFAFDERNASEVEKLLMQEAHEIGIESESEGVIVKADALGSLEAILKLLQAEHIPIRRAAIGKVLKRDILEEGSVARHNRLLGAVFAFHTELEQEARNIAEKEGVKIFEERIIYNLIINYKNWREESVRSERKEAFLKLTLPAKLRVLEGNVFRMSNPAIFGVEVLEGRIRKENRLIDETGGSAGTIRSIQVEREAVEEARKGQEVAIAVEGIYFGRQVKEKQVLLTDVRPEEMEMIEKKYLQSLSEGEREVLAEIKKIKGLLSFST